jgi:hypothetical protein
VPGAIQRGLRDLGVRPSGGDEVEDLPLAFPETRTGSLFLQQQGTVDEVDGK